ncbi:MAG: hypothetical protein ACPHF2_06955, partial [Crocinitomicaceae bacterium]
LPVYNPIDYYGTSAIESIGANKVDYPTAQGQVSFPFGIQFGPDENDEVFTQTSAYTGAYTFGSVGGTEYQNVTMSIDNEGKITDIQNGTGVVQYNLAIEDNGSTVVSNPFTLNFETSGTGLPIVAQDGIDPTKVNISVPACPDVTASGVTVQNPTILRFTSPLASVSSPSAGEVDIAIDGVTVQEDGVDVVTNCPVINFTGDDVTVTQDASGNAVVNVEPHTTQGYIKGLGYLYQYSFSQTYTQNAGTVNFVTGVYLDPAKSIAFSCPGPFPFSLYFDTADWGSLTNNYNNLVVMAVDYQTNVSRLSGTGGPTDTVQEYGYLYARGFFYINPTAIMTTSQTYNLSPSTDLTLGTAPTSYNYKAIASFKDGNSGGAVGWWPDTPKNSTMNFSAANVENQQYFFEGINFDGSKEGRYAVSYGSAISQPSAPSKPAWMGCIPFIGAGMQSGINGSETRTTQITCNVTFLQCPVPVSILATSFNPMSGKISQVQV